MKPSNLLIPIIVVAIGLGLFGYAATNKAPKPQEVTIGTFSKALGNSPYYVARSQQLFENDPALKGVKINYKEYNDRPSISDALSRGELQTLFSAEAPQILIKAQGNDIRIVNLSASVRQSILVPTDSPIQNITDLKGNKLAVLQGTSSQYGLLKILSEAGLKESDLTIQYMPPAEARAAFESGKLDAWAVWSPFVEQQEVSGKGRLVNGADVTIKSSMAIDANFIKRYPKQAKAIVKAVQQAKDWIITHPEEAQKVASEQLGLDLTVVQKAWPKHNWAITLDDAAIADIQEKTDFLTAQDQTRAGIKLDVKKELIDTELLRR